MLLSGLTIYAEDRLIENGYLVIDGGKIAAIGEGEPNDAGRYGRHVRFDGKHKLIPGMIDIHIHGAAGADTMDATPDALMTIAKALPKEGTTSFLATTITQKPEAIESALENVKTYMDDQPAGAAEVLGVHLEGPFINAAKAGAQPIEYIKSGDPDLFARWQKRSGDRIKVVTLAPEIDRGMELVKRLRDLGIVASIGHSAASFAEVTEAVRAGARHVTHLYNGMNGLHHRHPGVVGAAFLHEELFAEMIVDGVHISPEAVDIAYRLKGKDRIILITDAMRAKGLDDGTYDLGGQAVHVKDGVATLSGGQLAGSVLKMDQALRNMMRFTGADLADVIQMGAINPAIQIGVYDRKGSIREGKNADLVVLNERDEPVLTLCNGTVAYDRHKAS